MSIENIGSKMFYMKDMHCINGSKLFKEAHPFDSVLKEDIADMFHSMFDDKTVQKTFGDVNLLVRRVSKPELDSVPLAEIVGPKALNP